MDEIICHVRAEHRCWNDPVRDPLDAQSQLKGRGLTPGFDVGQMALRFHAECVRALQKGPTARFSVRSELHYPLVFVKYEHRVKGDDLILWNDESFVSS